MLQANKESYISYIRNDDLCKFKENRCDFGTLIKCFKCVLTRKDEELKEAMEME